MNRKTIYIIFYLFAFSLISLLAQNEVENDQGQENEAEFLEQLSDRLHFGGGTPEEYIRAAKYQYNLGTVNGFKTAKELLEDAVSAYDQNLDLILYYANILYDHGFEAEAMGTAPVYLAC